MPDMGQPGSGTTPPSPITGLYFCIDQNDQLLEYWDLVADRLFKIRHCQNIDGVVTPLALFSPPIDPGALVRAVAGGVDISSFLAGLSAPLPFYRFSVTIQKAVDLAQLASVFGNSLLQALEKRDAEALARLKSTHDIALAKAIRTLKQAAVDEGAGMLAALNLETRSIQNRIDYYSSREYMNAWETTGVALSGASFAVSTSIALGYTLSGGLKLLPQFLIGAAGFGGSPTASGTEGGDQVGGAAEMVVKTLESIAGSLDKAAALANTQGSYQRRSDEWTFQKNQADADLAKNAQDIANGTLHNSMLQADFNQQDLAVTQSIEMGLFMRSKFTNQELYDWMVSSTSTTYFKSYQLAFDVAKRAEQCLQLELGTDQAFLNFGWDSLKKGLLAADDLTSDIRAMEMAYQTQNVREYELTRHLSLTRLDPQALLSLRATGSCTISIPEAIFDLDHPGHYMRRYKSVSLSIPCIVGPYSSVNCKLSLISNRYRKDTTQRQGVTGAAQQYAEELGQDLRFIYNVGTVQSIATSSGTSDNGMFELNFHDDRYLPFEYTGAIGTWLLELPTAFRQFDYASITDVVLHLQYTARDGGAAFRALVTGTQKQMLSDMALDLTRQGLYQAYVLRQQFSNMWWSLQSTGAAKITLESRYLPYFLQDHGPTVAEVRWYAVNPPTRAATAAPTSVVITVDGADVWLNPATGDLKGWFTGIGGGIELGKQFEVTMPLDKAAELAELVFVVKIDIAS